jgi:phycocyanin alpha chain
MNQSGTTNSQNRMSGIRVKNSRELRDMAEYYRAASISLDAARILEERRIEIIAEASSAVFKRFPEFESSQRMQASCMRDIDYFVRLISYCLVAGNSSLIDEYCVGIKEVYSVFNLPFQCATVALLYFKNNHGLDAVQASTTNVYIDHLIKVFS